MAQAIASGMKPGDKIRTVKGKGGPTSDSVPAKIDGKNVKLSAGEKTIVIPAAVAQNSEAMEQIAAIIASATGVPPQEGIEEGGEYATGSVPEQEPKNIYQGSSIYQGAKNIADGVKGIGSALAAPVTKTADAVQSALTPADKPATPAEPAKPLTPLTLTLTPTTPYKAPEQKAPGAISQGIGNLWQGAKDLASGLALPVTKTLDAIGTYAPNADPRTQPATPAMQPATQPVTQPAAPSIASLPNANAEPSRPGVGAPATQPGGVYRAANGAMVRDVQMGGDTWTMLAAPTAKPAAAANDSIPADRLAALRAMDPAQAQKQYNAWYGNSGQAIAAPAAPTRAATKKPGSAIKKVEASGPLAEIAADDPLADMKRQFLKGEGKNTVPLVWVNNKPIEPGGEDHPLVPWLKENPNYYFGMEKKRPPADPAAEARFQEAVYLDSLRRLPPALGVAAYQRRYGGGQPSGEATPKADARTKIAEINAEARKEAERIKAEGQAEAARIRAGAKNGAQDAGAGGYPHFNTPAEARAARLPPGTMISTPQGHMRIN